MHVTGMYGFSKYLVINAIITLNQLGIQARAFN